MTIYIDEFLYRGRAPKDDQPPAWHVILRSIETDAFGRTNISDPHILNMQQAEDNGYDLPKVIADINSEIMRTCENQAAEIAKLKHDLHEAVHVVERPKADVDQSVQGVFDAVDETSILAKLQESDGDAT